MDESGSGKVCEEKYAGMVQTCERNFYVDEALVWI